MLVVVELVVAETVEASKRPQEKVNKARWLRQAQPSGTANI